MTGKVLEGIRVLELGQMLAGPFAGSILADLGAEVIKIERPDGGDDSRRMGEAFRYDDALVFHLFNRGKKSVALDLRSEQGMAGFEQLAATTDILVHNLRPGVTESFNIDGVSLCARYPRLIYCEISAFGHVGPMRKDPGFEPLVQAFSGLSSANGGPDDPPVRLGASVCDQGTGMWAVIAALSLLAQRARTGRGGVANLSLLETALVWNAQKSDSWVNEGKLAERHASGHPKLVPYEMFQTADLPILICCGNDRLFVKLADVMQRPQWASDPRYVTNRMRLQNKATLLAELGQLLLTRTRAEWLALFEHAGVPACALHSIPEAVQHPQVQALQLMQKIDGEDFSLTGLPMSFDGERPRLTKVAPRLGADTASLIRRDE